MSRYTAYLEKVARNREQFSRAQRAYDSHVPPCVEDEDNHPPGCICPECEEDRGDYEYHFSKDERED